MASINKKPHATCVSERIMQPLTLSGLIAGDAILRICILEETRVRAMVASPASLLDSQHGCIASPHAKESGQTPLAVWSCTVSKCGRTVSKDE